MSIRYNVRIIIKINIINISMEVDNIYVSNDVIDLIMPYLNLRSKIEFSQINKYIVSNNNLLIFEASSLS